jgi:hypothetical protein
MKVAVPSESSADEAAIRILVAVLLGKVLDACEPLPRPLAVRGYPGVPNLLPAVVRYLHLQTDVEGLAVVVDSNGSPVHGADHDALENGLPECRLCRLRNAVAEVRRRLPPRPVGGALKIAVGVPCPSIEAWYRSGHDPHATEIAWRRDLESGAHASMVIRQLKRAVYGTEIPSLQLETRRAVEEAQRLAGDLGRLERDFPNGFGFFAREVRGW